MLTLTNTPVMSPTCKKIALILLLSQGLLICFVYWNHEFIWTTLDRRIVKGVPLSTTGIYTPQYEGRPLDNHTHRHGAPTGRIRIAIGLGITTRKAKGLTTNTMEISLPFFRSLLTSFCQTCSEGFSYHFFIAYDYNDEHMSNKNFCVDFGRAFEKFTTARCPEGSDYSLHFVACSHTRKPAWAQNDAMLEAYISGVEYFYRINDDTRMKTPGWTEIYIRQLDKMSPPRVGVVGPKHKGGNVGILTYDFTHRTHLEIHGFYYPRYFTDWYGDRWITDVYKPGRSQKLQSVLLVHTMETGQRYVNKPKGRAKVQAQIQKDRATVMRYVTQKEKGFLPADPRKVIAMSLVSDEPSSLWGAVRNAQLAPVVFPGWTLKFYITGNSSSEFSAQIPSSILKVLTSLGAKLVKLNIGINVTFPLAALHYLVADDPGVDVFLLRNPSERLSDRDFAAVSDWLARKNENEAVHCIRDHSKYIGVNIVDGQWGAKSKQLHNIFQGTTIESLFNTFLLTRSQIEQSDRINIVDNFLQNVLSKQVHTHILYHDSVSCDNADGRNVLPFPIERSYKTYIGQTFDSHELPISERETESLILERKPQCERTASQIM